MINDDLNVMRLRSQEAVEAFLRSQSLVRRLGTGKLFQVTSLVSLPTTVPNGFATYPVQVSGTEVEGSPFSKFVDTSSTSGITIVQVLGPGVPKIGDLLIAYQIDGFWVAGQGGGTTLIRACSCDVPSSLHGTLVYPSYSPDAYGNCVNTGLLTRSFTLDYNPGSILARDALTGTVTIHGYWVSNCIATPDTASCCGGLHTECFARYFFFCGGASVTGLDHYYFGTKNYNADGHQGIGGPACDTDTFNQPVAQFTFVRSVFLSGTCSPFSQSFGTPGTNGYTLITS